MTGIILKDASLVSRLRAELLAWYDAHGRDLIWRRGERDPYRVWLSEVMLQQTTVAHATPYYEKFLALWPTVVDLAAAPDEQVMAQWAGLGYYARARRLLECARAVVRDHAGAFPDTEAGLLALPGFGPYTAAAVAAIAFGLPANVVDGNIERVMTRLYAIGTPLPKAKNDVRVAAAQWLDQAHAGDWPQALMDLAATVCRPKAPACLACPLREACCAFHLGDSERFPVKALKKPRPRRYGVAFLIERDGGFVVEQRAPMGLLGGMLGLPHTSWREFPWSDGEVVAPLDMPFSDLGSYEHVFTHFSLTQRVWHFRPDDSQLAVLLRSHNDWRIISIAEHKSLPTVFGKALDLKRYFVTQPQ